MTRALAIYLGAGIMAAWAILRAIDHFRGRQPEPPPWVEPEELPAPDIYVITLARDDPRVGTFSRN